jgi:hypothetical protein
MSTVLSMSIPLPLVKHSLSFRLCPIVFIFNGVQCFGSLLFFHLQLKWEETPFLLDCLAKGRLCLKCDGTCAETRFRLSAKQTSPFKSMGASVQSTTGSQGVRIRGINAGYTMF